MRGRGADEPQIDHLQLPESAETSRSGGARRRGSAGGRPPSFDADIYRERNSVERGYSRLNHWRGITTRCDKYVLTFLGGVLLATIITYHRVRELPDTT